MDFSIWNSQVITHLESLPKFVGHDVVEQRIHRRGQVIKHPGHVREDGVDYH